MKYTLKPGSIAAVQYLETEEGQIYDAIFMAEGKPAEVHMRGVTGNVANTLPMEVLARVNRNFGIMFALPYDKRQGLIDSTIPESFEA